MKAIACLLFIILALAAPAAAAEVTIVALGASNTYGKGVARGQDYPAQLQAMLGARGYAARVINAGINGDTTGGMASRLDSAVPAGTRVVILQPGGNDRRKGEAAGREGNISAIVARLNARGIKVVMLDRLLAGTSPQLLQPDGKHFTAEGHRALAARVLPKVIAHMAGR
jgi:acyl-CoA thioesterase I